MEVCESQPPTLILSEPFTLKKDFNLIDESYEVVVVNKDGEKLSPNKPNNIPLESNLIEPMNEDLPIVNAINEEERKINLPTKKSLYETTLDLPELLQIPSTSSITSLPKRRSRSNKLILVVPSPRPKRKKLNNKKHLDNQETDNKKSKTKSSEDNGDIQTTNRDIVEKCEITQSKSVVTQTNSLLHLVKECSVMVENASIPDNTLQNTGKVKNKWGNTPLKTYSVKKTTPVTPTKTDKSTTDKQPIGITVSTAQPISKTINPSDFSLKEPISNPYAGDEVIGYLQSLKHLTLQPVKGTPSANLDSKKLVLNGTSIAIPSTSSSKHVTGNQSNKLVLNGTSISIPSTSFSEHVASIQSNRLVLKGTSNVIPSTGSSEHATSDRTVCSTTIKKDADIEQLLDGAPPFIQEVLKCDNIRDGFINEDLIFVLSLLPDMEEMGDTEKLQFQLRVIETISDVFHDPVLKS